MEEKRKTEGAPARQNLGEEGVPGKSKAPEKKPQTTDRDLPQTGGSFDDGHVK